MRTHVVIIGGGPLGLWLLQVFFLVADHDDAPLPRCLGL